MPTDTSGKDAARPLLHFFSGKGGVGKTTLAAATAVNLARAGRRVLVTSTDPAHSLSDVFDMRIGDSGAGIEPNLTAIEVDSSARWAQATGTMSVGGKGKTGRLGQAMKDALGMLADAPGVDEFISLEIMLEAIAADAYDSVVFDTAPTGHTLRLLTLPGMLDGWIGKMLVFKSAFSKIGRAVRKLVPGGPGDSAGDVDRELLSTRERITQARDLICDARRSLFALVTIPEAMSVLETTRTLVELERHGIPVSVVIVNQLQPESQSCLHCRARRDIHLREVERMKELAGNIPLRLVESLPRVIRGPEELAELGQALWRKV
jgi:arsenite/tail-anchored protein-transporting ATPase